jgi:tetratricopeptide (TPR) repeat protein
MRTSMLWWGMRLFLSGLCIFLLPSTGSAQDGANLIKKGIELMNTRFGKPGNIAEAVEAYEQALKLDPNNAEILWRLSHAYLARGMEQATTKEEKMAAHDKGIDYGEKAAKANPSDPYGYFWTFGNQGEEMVMASMAAKPALVFKMKKNIDAMLAINQTTCPLGLYAKGRFHLELPVFLGGDMDKAIEWINKAIAVDPNFTMSYVELARALVAKKRYEEAGQVLGELSSKERKPLFPGDYAVRDMPEGLKLLKEVDARIKETKS